MIIGPLQWKGEFEPLWYRRGVLWSLKKMTPGLWFGFFRILKGNTIQKGTSVSSIHLHFCWGVSAFQPFIFHRMTSHLGVSKNRDTPKWMVKIMKNPMNKWMIWGENPLFSETHIWGTKNAWRLKVVDTRGWPPDSHENISIRGCVMGFGPVFFV